jgi:PhoH-like ATPase
LINEYLIINDSDGKAVDYYRWDGKVLQRVTSKQINNVWLGKVKPRNPQQVLAIDMLTSMDITVKVLSGKAGSGKSMLMINAAMDMVKNGKFDKIVYVRNNIEVKDTKQLGALPGDAYEKLQPFYSGLTDHVGDILMFRNVFEFIHLGYMRGRDIKNSIVMVNEAENLTCAHVGMLVSRIAQGSQLWLDGDYKQVDLKVFENNNGLLESVNRLKGNPLFGHVKLLQSERSATASLADYFD